MSFASPTRVSRPAGASLEATWNTACRELDYSAELKAAGWELLQKLDKQDALGERDTQVRRPETGWPGSFNRLQQSLSAPCKSCGQRSADETSELYGYCLLCCCSCRGRSPATLTIGSAAAACCTCTRHHTLALLHHPLPVSRDIRTAIFALASMCFYVLLLPADQVPRSGGSSRLPREQQGQAVSGNQRSAAHRTLFDGCQGARPSARRCAARLDRHSSSIADVQAASSFSCRCGHRS